MFLYYIFFDMFFCLGSHACSECSCENCDDDLDNEGPNQVNFLATTHETALTASSSVNRPADTTIADNKAHKSEDNYDLQQQLSMVIGALESRFEERKNSKVENELTKTATPCDTTLITAIENVSFVKVIDETRFDSNICQHVLFVKVFVYRFCKKYASINILNRELFRFRGLFL